MRGSGTCCAAPTLQRLGGWRRHWRLTKAIARPCPCCLPPSLLLLTATGYLVHALSTVSIHTGMPDGTVACTARGVWSCLEEGRCLQGSLCLKDPHALQPSSRVRCFRHAFQLNDKPEECRYSRAARLFRAALHRGQLASRDGGSAQLGAGFDLSPIDSYKPTKEIQEKCVAQGGAGHRGTLGGEWWTWRWCLDTVPRGDGACRMFVRGSRQPK